MDIVTLGAALNGSAEYVNSHFKGGSNIQIVDNPDGTQTINASGEVSSEDTVARAEIAAIKDGENIDSFGDVETALDTKANTSTTYTKTEVDTALSAKADKSTTYTKTEVDTALDDKVDKETGKGLSTNDFTTVEKTKLAGIAEGAEVNEIEGVKVNNTTINPDVNKVVNITVPTTAADVSALPDTTKYAVALSLTINSSTFVMTGQLKDQNGDNLGTAQTIDLPLESVVVGGSYNSQTKKVVLTLQNGNTIEFSVADLVSGLQTELSASNKLNPAYINYDSTHRAVSDTEKSAWNSKQNALSSTQLDAVNSGIDSTRVAQIETNKNNISKDKAVLVELVDAGAKNIIEVADAVCTRNGVTATLNSDGSIVLSGKAEGASNDFLICNNLKTGSQTSSYTPLVPIKSGNYVISGLSDSRLNLEVLNFNSSSDVNTFGGTEFIATKQYIDFRLMVKKTADFTTPLTIYPMCCTKAAWDISPAYQPYRPSYQELTEQIETNKNNILYAQKTGVKNIMDLSKYKELNPSVVVGDNLVFHGVTWTISNSSGLTVSGASDSGGSYPTIYSATLPIGTYYLSGGDSTIELLTPTSQHESGQGLTIEITESTTQPYIIRGLVPPNTSITGTHNIKPMLRQVGDSTFEPYAMSNAELTAKEQQNENNISSLTAELHALLPNITASTTIQDYANSLSRGVYTAFIANVSNPPDSPINANSFVNIYIYSENTAAMELIPVSSIEESRTYTMRKVGGVWRGWCMVEGTPVASSTQS